MYLCVSCPIPSNIRSHHVLGLTTNRTDKNQTKYYDSCKNKLSHSISPTLVSYENK